MSYRKDFEKNSNHKIDNNTSGSVELWEYIKYLEKRLKEAEKILEFYTSGQKARDYFEKI